MINVKEKRPHFMSDLSMPYHSQIHRADANCHYNEVTVISCTRSIMTMQYKKGRKDRGRPSLKMVLSTVSHKNLITPQIMLYKHIQYFLRVTLHTNIPEITIQAFTLTQVMLICSTGQIRLMFWPRRFYLDCQLAIWSSLLDHGRHNRHLCTKSQKIPTFHVSSHKTM